MLRRMTRLPNLAGSRVLLVAVAMMCVSCADSDTDTSNGLAFRGAVTSAVHAGRSWYVGGEFVGSQTLPAASLAVLDGSGRATVDCDLGAGFDGPVFAIAATDGAVFVGGAFSAYRGQPANAIAKLHAATCELDTTWSPPSGPNGFGGVVNALAVSGSSVYAGGSFGSYRGATMASTLLAKLDVSTGALDATFDTTVGAVTLGGAFVTAVAVSAQRVYIGGLFEISGDGVSFENFAGFDLATGALTAPAGQLGIEGFTGTVDALAVVGDSIYVGGGFLEYRLDPTPAWNLVKLDLATGDADPSFVPAVGSRVRALVATETGLFVGGDFPDTDFGGNSRAGLVKVDLETGAAVAGFNPVANGVPQVAGSGVFSLSAAAGVVYVGGHFASGDATVNGFVAIDALTGRLVGRLLPRGHDIGGFDGRVLALAASGSRVWAGGTFHGYGGRKTSYLVKLDDTTFAPDSAFASAERAGFDGSVHALVVAGDALYVGGSFTSYRGVPNSARGLAKLDLRTGEIDTSFSPPGRNANGVTGTVYALAVSGDSLIVGGEFNSYRGESTNSFVKVSLTTGALNETFNPTGVPVGFSGGADRVRALAVSGTSLFVGGDFEAHLSPGLTTTFCLGLAKLDLASGEFDAAFAPAVDLSAGFGVADVRALAVSESALYVGGAFTTYGGASANAIAKLDLANGALDTTFSPAAANGFAGSVESLGISGASLFVGGNMASYRGDGMPTNGLVKLNAVSGALDATFASPSSYVGFDLGYNVVVPHEDVLFVGGDFRYYDGSRWTSRAAILDATTAALR